MVHRALIFKRGHNIIFSNIYFVIPFNNIRIFLKKIRGEISRLKTFPFVRPIH